MLVWTSPSLISSCYLVSETLFLYCLSGGVIKVSVVRWWLWVSFSVLTLLIVRVSRLQKLLQWAPNVVCLGTSQTWWNCGKECRLHGSWVCVFGSAKMLLLVDSYCTVTAVTIMEEWRSTKNIWDVDVLYYNEHNDP